MFGGINPSKIQGMMKKMGINQEEILADRVIIEKTEGSGKIIIENPNVQKVSMQGQESWQITGDVREEIDEGIKESDIKAVMEKTGKSEEESRKALEESNGDLAEAILNLS